MDTAGKHCVADFWGVPDDILNNTILIKQAALDAAGIGQMRILRVVEYRFDNGGYTLLLLLAESHLSIHTYPEHRYIALDVFTCGSGQPEAAYRHLLSVLRPETASMVVLQRGQAGGIHLEGRRNE